jgi:hypothetical protein
MLSGKLENFNKKHPELASLVKRLAAYVETQRERGVRELIPRVVAAQLDVSEADALALLSLFEDAKLIKHQYDLVCVANGTVIASFASLDKVPSEIDCQHCGGEHDGDGLRVELVFEILRERSADAAA